VRFASPGGSVIPGTQWTESCASTEETILEPKIGIINVGLLRDLSEIKLKRTDTTLDLSQKAKRAKEKRKGKSEAWRGWARLYTGSQGGGRPSYGKSGRIWANNN
jgi:hypothetical protein